MGGQFAEGYREILASIAGRTSANQGYPLKAIEAAEGRLGFRIPEALRDYYLAVGRHELNRVFHQLRLPEELEVSGGRLLFMDENQGAYCWGVGRRTASADPMVVQLMDEDEGQSISVRCSAFLPAMLCYFATSEWLPHKGYSDEMPAAAARRLVKGWASAGRCDVHSAYVRDGLVVTIERYEERYDDGVQVRVGSRNRRQYDALVSEFGIAIHQE